MGILTPYIRVYQHLVYIQALYTILRKIGQRMGMVAMVLGSK